LNALDKQGLAVFRGKGGCTTCHAGPNFTDERFHNTGIAWREGRLKNLNDVAKVGKIGLLRVSLATPV
jgi:cytochrome c peroxidase